MPDSITVFAQTAINTDNGGDYWTNPGNVTIDDGNEARNTNDGTSVSDYLDVTAFGDLSSIPTNANIVGLEIEVERARHSQSNGCKDSTIQLLKNGTPVGQNKASASGWPIFWTPVTYGGSSDLWGTTWTRNDVVNNLGFRLAVTKYSTGGFIAWVDYVKVTIYYSTVQHFSGNTNNPVNGSADVLRLLEYSGNTDIPFDGSTVIAGGTITYNGNTNTAFDGNAEIKRLFSYTGNTNLPFDGSADTDFNFDFKWSIEHLEAKADHDFPAVYVEAKNTAMPTGSFPEGKFFERRLLEVPRVEEAELDARVGITGFQRVSIVLDNSDRLFNGVKFQDTFIRVWFTDGGNAYKEFKGQITDWVLSHRVTASVEDIEAIAFTQDLPRRTINMIAEAEKTADPNFDNVDVADDLGNPLPIIFGRAVKVPLLYIKADETNREYDYLVGEGEGLNGNNFEEIFTVYRNDIALDSIEGDVQSATTTTLTLENADRRPDAWYKYWWIEILDGTTGALIEIRDVTDYDESLNRVTVNSAWTTTPTTSEDYRLREWRFYDGSQSSPYDGVAFIRLKKRMGARGSLDNLYADVDGLQDETNVVRAVQSVLSNSVWGLGVSVDTASFDSAAALSEITSMKCEGALLDTTTAIDFIKELLRFRDMTLTKGNAIEVNVDQSKTSGLVLGLGDDTGYNNILTESPEIRHIHPDEKVKNLRVRYRKNYKESDIYLQELEREANPNGVDETHDLPFVYEHTTADRLLDYRRKRIGSYALRMSLEVGEDGKTAGRGDLVTVDIPSLGVEGHLWEVTGTSVTPAGSNTLDLAPYDGNTYSYEASSTLPTDEEFDIPPDYVNTPPDPVSSLVATAGTKTTLTGDKIGYIDITWTTPNDGNYMDAVVSIKETGQAESFYRSVGSGFNSFTVNGLEANTSYDVLVESRNEHNLKGLGVVDIGNYTGGATTAPSTPAKPAVFRFGRQWRFSVDPNPSSENISHYNWEIATSSGTVQDTVENAGTEINWNASGTSTISYKARVKAVNIYGQESSFSIYSNTVSNEKWSTGHYNNSSVTNPVIGNGQVDENKRIVVFTSLHTYANFNLAAGAKASSTFSNVHNKGRKMNPALRASHNIKNSTGVIGSSYIDANSTTHIAARYEVTNHGSAPWNDVSITHELYYW